MAENLRMASSTSDIVKIILFPVRLSVSIQYRTGHPEAEDAQGKKRRQGEFGKIISVYTVMSKGRFAPKQMNG